MKFNHVGIPVKSKKTGMNYVPEMKIHLNDPYSHPYSIEYILFDADAPQPNELKTMVHVAYEVPNLEDAVKDADRVVIEPFQRMPGLRLSFVVKDGLLMELMEYK